MTLQTYPAVPALKELMAMSTDNKEWRNLRPPIVSLPYAGRVKLLEELDKLDFDIQTMSAKAPLRSVS